MAYNGFGERFDTAPREESGFFRTWIAGWFTKPEAELAPVAAPAKRKLAGPDPLDKRSRGHMADLDMEMGF